MQVLVIGAGVVGLAVARAAALAGHDVIVAEAANAIGTGISSRNSEVIHAGIYYPTGTLRGAPLRRGRRMLYDYLRLARRAAPQVRQADRRHQGGRAAEDGELSRRREINGVEGLAMLGGCRGARAWSRRSSCVAALHSPETGIIDSHRYMLALQGDLEDRRRHARASTRRSSGCTRKRRRLGGRIRRQRAGRACRSMPSSTPPGLARRRWRARSEGYPATRVPRLVLGKGNYFGYRRASRPSPG